MRLSVDRAHLGGVLAWGMVGRPRGGSRRRNDPRLSWPMLNSHSIPRRLHMLRAKLHHASASTPWQSNDLLLLIAEFGKGGDILDYDTHSLDPHTMLAQR